MDVAQAVCALDVLVGLIVLSMLLAWSNVLEGNGWSGRWAARTANRVGKTVPWYSGTAAQA